MDNGIHIMIISFGIVLIAMIALSICVLKLVLLGRHCARGETMCIARHKRAANITILVVFLLIVAVEGVSLLSSVHMTDSTIFIVHIFFAISFLLLLVMLRFWLTGLHAKNIHRPLAYTAGLSYVGVATTGIIMLGGMFPF